MRILSRPPTALCTLAMYVCFLLSEPRSSTCRRLAEVMQISHDSVNRFLFREGSRGQQSFCLFKIRGIKSFCKPAI